ncbi:hypothetical protein ACQJBY_033345 [Aegilops geniculata]
MAASSRSKLAGVLVILAPFATKTGRIRTNSSFLAPDPATLFPVVPPRLGFGCPCFAKSTAAASHVHVAGENSSNREPDLVSMEFSGSRSRLKLVLRPDPGPADPTISPTSAVPVRSDRSPPRPPRRSSCRVALHPLTAVCIAPRLPCLALLRPQPALVWQLARRLASLCFAAWQQVSARVHALPLPRRASLPWPRRAPA